MRAAPRSSGLASGVVSLFESPERARISAAKAQSFANRAASGQTVPNWRVRFRRRPPTAQVGSPLGILARKPAFRAAPCVAVKVELVQSEASTAALLGSPRGA